MAAVKLAAVFLFLVSHVYCMDVYRMSIEDEKRIFGQQKQQVGAGTFAFAKQFQDHMVLQQSPAKATIYGFASDSDVGQQVSVTVTTPTQTYNYQSPVTVGASDSSGQWLVTLDAVDAGTTVSITATLGGTTLKLDDVIYGDVWLCSGQSNMEMTVSMMDGHDAEIADAGNYPDIRVMTVDNTQSHTPQSDLTNIKENWSKASSASIGGPNWQYFSAVCWVFGKTIYKARNYPIGLISVDWGGTPAEAWSSSDALAACGVSSDGKHKVQQPESYVEYVNSLPAEERTRLRGPSENSVLWNSMVNPLTKMTVYGAIWYQGESDAGNPLRDRYNCTFPEMIKDWRKKFNSGSGGQTSDVFPFGFVQLAPNTQGNKPNGFTDIRWHQTADHGYVPNPDMPNTFMSVALDLPDFDSTYGSIHPQDKLDVGERLALAGRAVAYGEAVVFQGPFPEKIEVQSDNSVVISYGDKWTLDIRDPDGFEVRCASTWTPAPIASNDQKSVTLKNVCQGNAVTQVRYVWNESPCEFKKCAVYSTVNELPAPPFILAPSSVNEKGEPYFKFHRP